MRHVTVSLTVIVLLYSCSCNENPPPEENNTNDSNPAPLSLSYNIVKIYPHDTSSYTEGLVWQNNMLYESTGNKGKSRLRKINLETGKTVKDIKLADEFFGEGIAIMNNKIYQLTWQEHKVFVYDATTLEKIQEMAWPYDGWGMTHNGKELIIGTGGSVLYFVNPDNFKIIWTISVTDNYGPVGDVNELEYVNGFIYANVYGNHSIIKINAETGKVTAKIDLTNILDNSGVPHDAALFNSDSNYVLNGIAYDAEKNSFYVTGKWWPALFEIKLN